MERKMFLKNLFLAGAIFDGFIVFPLLFPNIAKIIFVTIFMQRKEISSGLSVEMKLRMKT
jgi:hypothetical protein